MNLNTRAHSFLLTLLLSQAAHAQQAGNPAPERIKKLSREETDRALFIDIGKANLLSDKTKWGELVIDKWLVRYKEEVDQRQERMSAGKWREVMNKAHNRYQAESKLLDDSTQVSTRGADYAKLGMKVVTSTASEFGLVKGSSAIQAAAELGIEIARDLYIDSVGQSRQIGAQNELKDIPWQAEEILGQLYDAGMQDKDFRDAHNASLALTSRAYIGISARDNVSINIEHASRLRLEHAEEAAVSSATNTENILRTIRANINTEGQLLISYGPIGNMIQRLNDDISKKITESTNTIAGLLIDQAQAQEQRQKETSVKVEIYNTAYSSVYLLSGLSGIFDPASAKQMQAYGTAAIQVSAAVDKFIPTLAGKLTEKLMGCVNLVAGIATAVQSLFSALVGSDPMQTILDQIARLSWQIERLQIEMGERFDRVDRNIGSLFYAMQLGFSEVEKKLQGIAISQDGLTRAASDIADALERLDGKLYLYLRDGFRERVVEEINLCRTLDPNMSTSDFHRCLERFRTYSTHNSTNTLAAGAANAVAGSQSSSAKHLFSSLNEELKKGVWPNINLIGTVLAVNFGDFSLIAPNRQPLVNLQDWGMYSNQYVDFVTEHPSFIKLVPDMVLKTTDDILASGDALQAALGKLSQSRSEATDGKEAKKGIVAALDDYEHHLKQMEQSINVSWKRYQQDTLGTYAATMPIDKQPWSENLRIAFSRRSNNVIGPCEGYKLPGFDVPNPALTFPDKIGELALLPAEVHMAENLGLGTVQVCYENAEWADPKEELQVDLDFRHAGTEHFATAMTQLGPLGWTGQFRRDEINMARFSIEEWSRYKDMFQKGHLEIEKFLGVFASRISGKLSVMLRFTFEPSVHTNAESETKKPWTISKRQVTMKDYSERFHLYRRLTNWDTREMEARFGSNSSKWLRYKDFWLMETHDNGWGNHDFEGHKEDFDAAKRNLLAEELRGKWHLMANDYTARSREALAADEWKQANIKLRGLIQEKFQNTVQTYQGHLMGALRNGTGGMLVKNAAEALDGSRAFLLALYTLGFPESVESNDRLHALIEGADPLLDSAALERLISEKTPFNPDSSNSFVEANKKISELRALTTGLLKERPSQERNPVLTDTLSRLEMLKSAVELGHLDQSIDSALAELTSLLAEIGAGRG